MKKILLLIIATLALTGCSEKTEGSSDGLFSYNNSKILDKYETKTLSENVTYKEITASDSDGNLELKLIVYNNTDKAIYVRATGDGYKDGSRTTNQVTQGSYDVIAANSAGILGFLFFGADDYKITNFEVEEREGWLPNDAYIFEDYKIDVEKEEIELYFKYNSEGKNSTSLDILGFKNGNLIAGGSCFMRYIDENGKVDYKADISKKGDRVKCESSNIRFFTDSESLNDIDKYVYFYDGYYED